MDVILDTCALLSLAGLVEKRISAETLDIVRSAYQVGVSSCSLFDTACLVPSRPAQKRTALPPRFLRNVL